MAKYGYHCKFCGFTFNSDNKKNVKEAKQRHNAKIRNPMFTPAYPHHQPMIVRVDCSLAATKRGTLIRSQIA